MWKGNRGQEVKNGGSHEEQAAERLTRRIALFCQSVTTRAACDTAMPFGLKNRAALAAPSTRPRYAAIPAMPDTAPLARSNRRISWPLDKKAHLLLLLRPIPQHTPMLEATVVVCPVLSSIFRSAEFDLSITNAWMSLKATPPRLPNCASEAFPSRYPRERDPAIVLTFSVIRSSLRKQKFPLSLSTAKLPSLLTAMPSGCRNLAFWRSPSR
mmetsp:Transcript_36617/g.92088  ORF Transcript_36617/g.92088 Transcript_36617/m.92088 type:complete len:212 (-) Transcript_36617:798-1433(-)